MNECSGGKDGGTKNRGEDERSSSNVGFLAYPKLRRPELSNVPVVHLLRREAINGQVEVGPSYPLLDVRANLLGDILRPWPLDECPAVPGQNTRSEIATVSRLTKLDENLVEDHVEGSV